MWTDMTWDAGHAAPDPLRVKILRGLAYSATDIRERIAGHCRDCGAEPCPDHADAAELAAEFEDTYMQVATGSTAWCDLAVKLISEMN